MSTEQGAPQPGAGGEAASSENPGTIAGGGAAPQQPSPPAGGDGAAAGGWPEDWRDRMAGEDTAFRKRLDRFAAPTDVGKSFVSLEKKFSSGGVKTAMPENATPEQVTAWRKENGIPENVDGYMAKLALPNGMVVGEADKPLVQSFADRALKGNWSPQVYNDAVNWYYETQDQQRAAQQEADATYHDESVSALQSEWAGADYKRNVNAVNNMLSGWPADLRDGVLAARTPDGRLLGDHPAFIKQLATLALDLNPTATLLPTSGGSPMKGVEDRLSELNKWMGAPHGSDDWKKYWRDDKVQQEYRDLVDAQNKMKERAA